MLGRLDLSKVQKGLSIAGLIRIVDTHARQNPGFETLHHASLRVVFMVESERVKCGMHTKVCSMVEHSFVLFCSFLSEHGITQYDICLAHRI